MKVLQLVLIGTLTVCWYSSSSKNAVATQQLVEEMGGSSPWEMLVLTALQLLYGLCVGLPLYQCLLSCGGVSPVPWTTRNKSILGFLHFLGCLCMNIGFAFGSASVVQVIKLMEPIETLILTALANVLIFKVSHDLTLTKFISVVAIVSGASKLLSEKRDSDHGHDVNFGSVFFALCSGFAMASRNVFMKAFAKKETNSPPNDGWTQIAVNGLFDYISITSAAAVPGTLFLMFAEIHGSSQIKEGKITSFIIKSLVGKEAIVFHGLYNIASISVLCLISAQAHSLLNVGKRIVNVLYAAFTFHELIGFKGFFGLCISGMGSILYSTGDKMTKIQRYTTYYAILATMFPFRGFIPSPGKGKIPKSLVVTFPEEINSSAFDLCGSTPDSNVVIWTYPYKPDASWYQEELEKNPEITFICGFPSVCRQEIHETDALASINLRELTTGTSYESFILNHFYFKVLHGKEYIHHVQSVAICSMLSQEGCGSISVNPTSTTYNTEIIKGGSQELLERCKEYDPTKNGTEPIFRETIERNQPYAILAYDTRIKRVGLANSGDEVQSLAGLQFLPEHTMTVDREEGFSSIEDDGSSPILIANAWYGESYKFPPPLPTESKNNNIVFTSLHFNGRGKEVITRHKQYWEAYNSQIGPIGARDTATLNFLQSQGLATYLSLCFTVNFQLPRSSKLVAVDQKPRGDEILLVDVVSSADLPPEILARATKLECNIFGPEKLSEKARHRWAHDLLSAYADRASVVITSRIHSALPAAAMGIPVIFIEDADNLPGGGGDREAGIANLFHYQSAIEKWKFGTLTESLPPVPGVHRIDRYRASFWKLLKERSPIFEETARLYGLIPLQRLGKNVPDTYHSLFHFIVTSKDMNWRMIRAIEYVFYHHPNAQVTVHCKFPDLIRNILNIFVETGYNLVVKSYDTEEMLRDFGKNVDIVSEEDIEAFVASLPELRKGKFWYSHESDILRFLIIYAYGGIYLDIDVYVLRPLEKTFVNNLGKQTRNSINGSFMNFERHHQFPKMALQWIIQNYNVNNMLDWAIIGPDMITRLINTKAALSQSLTILPEAAIQPIPFETIIEKCFEKQQNNLDLTNSYAMHMNNQMTKEFMETKVGTICDEVFHRFCIFCHEIHSTGKGNFPNSPVVTFPEEISSSAFDLSISNPNSPVETFPEAINSRAFDLSISNPNSPVVNFP